MDSTGVTPAEALALGWSIIPTGRNKKPLIQSWKPYQQRPPTVVELADWIAAKPSTWAIVTGAASKRITLDFDGEIGRLTLEKLGIGPHRRTPSGGYHADFVHPGWHVPTLNSKTKRELGKRWPGLDIRADGGYAVFSGKTDSGDYEWLRDPAPYSLDILPTDLRDFIGLLRRPNEPQVSGSNGNLHAQPEYGRVDSERLIRMAVDHTGEGRNNAGFWLSQQLRDNGYSEHESENLVRNYAARCPETNTKGQIEPYGDTEIRATVREVFTRPAREPWHPPASPSR